MVRYLIDTNVLMAASAVEDFSALYAHAMPLETTLREQLYGWLVDFEKSLNAMVLDEEHLIRSEYERNMRFNQTRFEQEYGMRVLQNKQDRTLVEYVPIEMTEASGEKIAVLPTILEGIVTDRADRKWVAAAIAHQTLFGEASPIIYGADTDWYVAETSLVTHGLKMCRLLPDSWYKDRLGAIT